MNEESRRQYLLLGGVAIVALVGIGIVAFLAGQLLGSSASAEPETPTPIPTPTEIPVTLSAIKSKAELATVEHASIAEIRKETLPEGLIDQFFNTKEELLLLVYGDVRAGFDLEQLEEENLWTDGTRVRLVLPAPQVLNSSIDFERTHTVHYENNLIFQENNPDLQQEALAEAKKALEQAALEAGILEQANEYGQLYFENLLYSLGFTEVEVVVDAQIFKE